MRSWCATALGLLFLILTLFAAIVNLPSFALLSAKGTYLKICWRYLGLLYFMSPMLAMDIYRLGPGYLLGFIMARYDQMFWLSVLTAAHVALVYAAACRTYFVHALLLSSLATTFVSVWKIASKQGYTRFEWIGLGINVFGAYLCCCDGLPLKSTV